MIAFCIAHLPLFFFFFQRQLLYYPYLRPCATDRAENERRYWSNLARADEGAPEKGEREISAREPGEANKRSDGSRGAGKRWERDEERPKVGSV